MSVLKDKRLPSKAEYVNTANEIYIETMAFLPRLSARYSRLMAGFPAKLAAEVVEYTEKANKIFPSDEQRKQLRKAHLLQAQSSLSALDVALLHCYLVMVKNPQVLHRQQGENGVGGEGDRASGRDVAEPWGTDRQRGRIAARHPCQRQETISDSWVYLCSSVPPVVGGFWPVLGVGVAALRQLQQQQ